MVDLNRYTKDTRKIKINLAGRFWKRQNKHSTANHEEINRRWERFLEKKKEVNNLRSKEHYKRKNDKNG